MRKPTNTENMYPDCFGHLDDMADERIERIAKWVVRAITTVIAIGLAGYGWTIYHQIFN